MFTFLHFIRSLNPTRNKIQCTKGVQNTTRLFVFYPCIFWLGLSAVSKQRGKDETVEFSSIVSGSVHFSILPSLDFVTFEMDLKTMDRNENTMEEIMGKRKWQFFSSLLCFCLCLCVCVLYLFICLFVLVGVVQVDSFPFSARGDSITLDLLDFFEFGWWTIDRPTIDHPHLQVSLTVLYVYLL